MRLVTSALFLLLGIVTVRISESSMQTQSAKEPFPGVLDEHPVIGYRTAQAHDQVAQLNEALATGTRSLEYRPVSGYLHSLLAALNISSESQLLVFSRTGIQGRSTSPQTPRALYFNDSVVVGFIAPARFLEIAAHDPEQGVNFYLIDQSAGAVSVDTARPITVSRPSIARRTDCLSCHVSGSTMEVPGMIARSMFTARNGDSIPQLGSYVVDHRTPLRQRWGGWFVTGAIAAQRSDALEHMGNVATTMDARSGAGDSSSNLLPEWVKSGPESRGYYSTQSDVAALMVFDHQMHAMNLLTRLNWETRVAIVEHRADFTAGPLGELAEELVDYFLFVGEARFPAMRPSRGGFTEVFLSGGKKDRKGRSLRELELEHRLLRYPCSYMIDSDAFAKLPASAKQAVYARLVKVLTGRDARAKYGHLSSTERAAILEILRDTGHDLPQINGQGRAGE